MEFEPFFVKAAARALVCMILTTFTEGACPKIVFIERRSSSTISCVTQDKIIAEAFWYRGSISHTIPILRLENGNPGGTEYGKGQYVVDSKGAMTIHNASVVHEADYFFVAFFEDDTFHKSNVTVVITVLPDPPCPQVTNCFSCEVCHLNVSGNGTVTCSMLGVRPKMDINWITEGEPGTDITLHQRNVKNNSNGYTWDVSIGLSYGTYTCGQRFVLQCIAHDDRKLLKYSTPVYIETENCNDGGALGNKQSVLISTIVVMAILIVILVISAICYKARRKDQRSLETTVDPEEQPLTSSKSAYLDTAAQRTADYLKGAYEPQCSVHVLPWEDPIPISAVNIDYELTFKNAQETNINSSCHEILRNISLNDLHRVMITADRGNGKTYFMKQIIHQWSQEKVNSFILIYIDADDISQNMDIMSMILKMLPTSHNLTKEVIHQVLNSNEVLVLIDGLDELTVGDGEKSSTAESEKQRKSDTESTDNISRFNARQTIKEILENNLNEEDNNVHVWITTRGLQDTRYEFKLPYVKINLPEFSEQQMNSYIKKTCSYYINFKELTEGKQGSTENTPHQKDKAKANSEDVIRMVQKIVNENNVLRDFKNNFFLLSLLVHIIAAKLTITPEYLHNLIVENMASLIATIIEALLLRYSRKNTKLSKELIDKIKITLEEVAFRMTVPDETIQVRFPKDRNNIIRIAEAVGILEEKEQDNVIDVYFSHTRIEEYFAAKYISKLDKVKYQSIKKTIEKSHGGVWKLILCLEGLE